MKNHTKIIFLFILASTLFSFKIQSIEDTYSLVVNVKNLRNSKGVVQFALYNKNKSIPDAKYKKYYKMGASKINQGNATITFRNLPKGTYAVSALHDENKNQKIDKKFILPLEGIGFSNYNEINLSNRPNYDKASFVLEKNRILFIKMIYK